MVDEIQNYITLIEATLINEESPSYLEVSYQNGIIYVLISKPEYKDYLLHERIQAVHSLLQFEHDDIISIHPIIVECLTEQELDDLFRLYNNED